MKRLAFSLGAAFVLAFAPLSIAQAVLLGSVDTAGVDLNDPNATAPTAMYNLSSSGTRTLNTTVVDSGSVIGRFGTSLYFTNAAGLQKQKVGTSTVTAITPSTTLTLMAVDGKRMIVGNSAVADKKKDGSFWYNAATGKSTRFSPMVGTVASADISVDGKNVAMIAKNAAGKNRLWLSRSPITTLRSTALPKNASDCTDIAFSPNGKLVALNCQYSTGWGIVLLPVAETGFGTAVKKIDAKFSPIVVDWLSETSLVAGGYGEFTLQSLFNVEYRVFTVKGGKITKSKTMTFDQSDFAPAGSSILSPAQVLRQSAAKFYHVFTYLGTDPDDPAKTLFGSMVGLFDAKTGGHSVLVDDGKLNVLTEAHLAS